jgi:hypothetical protein
MQVFLQQLEGLPGQFLLQLSLPPLQWPGRQEITFLMLTGQATVLQIPEPELIHGPVQTRITPGVQIIIINVHQPVEITGTIQAIIPGIRAIIIIQTDRPTAGKEIVIVIPSVFIHTAITDKEVMEEVPGQLTVVDTVAGTVADIPVLEEEDVPVVEVVLAVAADILAAAVEGNNKPINLI